MKVLIVTGIFPPDIGGPAGYVPRIAKALHQRGSQITVLCLSDRLDVDDSGWPFKVIRLARNSKRWRRMFTVAAAVFAAARQADVVFVNGLALESALASKLARKPFICKVVGDVSWEQAQNRGWFDGTLDEYQLAVKDVRLWLLDRIAHAPLRFAARIIVPSEYLRRIVQGWRLGHNRIQIIYNAVSGVEFPHAQELVREGNCPIRLLTICRLTRWKGIPCLLKVIAEEPSWRLTIAGDGPLRNDLETEAVRLGIAARVRFAGQLTPEGIRRELSQADALVLNSSYEGLPHVVLEAMSAGLPAVCSAAGGTPEIVRDGVTGLLFPHNDAFAFRTQITRLMNDPQLRRRLIANARRMLDTSFSSEFMVESLESALKSTASSGSLWVSEPHTAHSSQRA